MSASNEEISFLVTPVGPVYPANFTGRSDDSRPLAGLDDRHALPFAAARALEAL